MKVDTALNKILNSGASVNLKISKLQTLALRQFPSSPNQKAVNAARVKLILNKS